MNFQIKQLIILIAILISNLSYAMVEQNYTFDTPYGDNKAVGLYAKINGVELYFEAYGKGEPLILIHGNGGSILDMGNQIDYFKSKYRVIIADNRGHGKSGLNTDYLSYEQMTKDWEGLINHLKLDSINVVGWSDGGIIGLLLGINNNVAINKIVVMGANLRPDATAVHSWVPKEVNKLVVYAKKMITEGDDSEDWELQLQQTGLLLGQPNISHADLKKIKAPVLVMAGDKDIIKNEHTVEIFKHIPNAHLSIMPGETHFTPASNPELFNGTVNKFLYEPYKRPLSDWTK